MENVTDPLVAILAEYPLIKRKVEAFSLLRPYQYIDCLIGVIERICQGQEENGIRDGDLQQRYGALRTDSRYLAYFPKTWRNAA